MKLSLPANSKKPEIFCLVSIQLASTKLNGFVHNSFAQLKFARNNIASNSRSSLISSEKCKKVLPFEIPLPHTNSAFEKQSIEPVDHQTNEMDLIFEPDEFVTFSIDTSDGKLPLSSNAGVPVVNYQLGASHSDRVPTKVLLNKHLNVLQGTKVPLWTTNAHKNFLQSNVARIPNTSVPLLYPEALVFRNFWKPENDGFCRCFAILFDPQMNSIKSWVSQLLRTTCGSD